jgi:hypothetical protein
MGRKRILKNREDEEWEGASVVSLAGSTSTLGRVDEENTAEDEFLNAIEETYESRGSTREAAFGRLCAAMRQRVCSVRVFCVLRARRRSTKTAANGGCAMSVYTHQVAA